MKQTIFRIYTVGGVAPVPAVTGLTQGTNGQVAVPNTTSTTVLAANASRRYASIMNNTGSTIYLNFAAAAALVTSYPLKDGQSFDIGPDTTFGMYLGEVRAFQNSGGALNVNVLEMT